MTWFYHNTTKEFTEEDIKDYFGFVYLITNTQTGRKYIGKKFFTKSKTRQIKGKKKKSRVSSDWMKYWGSNTELQEEVKLLGEGIFRREILHLCKWAFCSCSCSPFYRIVFFFLFYLSFVFRLM